MAQMLTRLLNIKLPKGQSAFLWGPRKTGKTTFINATFPESLKYDLIQTVFYGLGAGLGWSLAITLMAGLREKMGYSNIPPALKGTGIVMLIAGVIAMTFMGFAGMLSA